MSTVSLYQGASESRPG